MWWRRIDQRQPDRIGKSERIARAGEVAAELKSAAPKIQSLLETKARDENKPRKLANLAADQWYLTVNPLF